MTGHHVEHIPLDDVLGAVRNPKAHDLEIVRASVERFGYVSPAVRDDRTGRLVVGHGRTEVLRQMRTEGQNPPAGVQVAPDGGWLVPVICGWSSRSDAEAEAYLIADNQHPALGGWDDDGLATLLADLAEADAELFALTGFTDEDLDALLGEDADDGEPASRTDPDDVPGIPAEARTNPGDLWLLGPHRLLCGDSTAAGVGERLGIAEGVDLILTDPPYCSGGFQETGRAAGSVGTNATHKQIANDRLSTRGYIALLKAALAAVPASYAYVFTDWRMWVYLFDVVESCGFGVRSMIVWDKSTPGMGRGWRSQHELIMWVTRQTPPFDKYSSGRGNVIQSARTGNDLHTTQKPVDLLATLLETAEFAATVYDPFAGSGSTLIAAHRTGRIAYLSELDPLYCDVICRRWQEHTGVLPVLESTGQAVDFVGEAEPADIGTG